MRGGVIEQVAAPDATIVTPPNVDGSSGALDLHNKSPDVDSGAQNLHNTAPNVDGSSGAGAQNLHNTVPGGGDGGASAGAQNLHNTVPGGDASSGANLHLKTTGPIDHTGAVGSKAALVSKGTGALVAKIATVAVPTVAGLAAVGAGAYYYNKHRLNKKKWRGVAAEDGISTKSSTRLGKLNLKKAYGNRSFGKEGWIAKTKEAQREAYEKMDWVDTRSAQVATAHDIARGHQRAFQAQHDLNQANINMQSAESNRVEAHRTLNDMVEKTNTAGGDRVSVEDQEELETANAAVLEYEEEFKTASQEADAAHVKFTEIQERIREQNDLERRAARTAAAQARAVALEKAAQQERDRVYHEAQVHAQQLERAQAFIKDSEAQAARAAQAQVEGGDLGEGEGEGEIPGGLGQKQAARTLGLSNFDFGGEDERIDLAGEWGRHIAENKSRNQPPQEPGIPSPSGGY